MEAGRGIPPGKEIVGSESALAQLRQDGQSRSERRIVMQPYHAVPCFEEAPLLFAASGREAFAPSCKEAFAPSGRETFAPSGRETPLFGALGFHILPFGWIRVDHIKNPFSKISYRKVFTSSTLIHPAFSEALLTPLFWRTPAFLRSAAFGSASHHAASPVGWRWMDMIKTPFSKISYRKVF